MFSKWPWPTQHNTSHSINFYICLDTLKEILREIDNKLSEEDLDGIIEEVDEDGSGTLDFDGRFYQLTLII